MIFENKSNSFLKSMELNVLDSLNTKMLRPEGSSIHDGIPVPFQLPPGNDELVLDRGGGLEGSSSKGWGIHSALETLGFLKEASVGSQLGLVLVKQWLRLDSKSAEVLLPPANVSSFLKNLGVSNEAQFVFTLQSIIMAQKLKGTLSFIAKVRPSLLLMHLP